jgi:outer membrane beta-barrel protein
MIHACLALLATATALAAEPEPVDPVDLGVVRSEEVVVVQRLLYPKSDRTELGLGLGWAAWERYLTTPSVQLSVDVHRSESLAFSGVLGLGWGLPNGLHNELRRDHDVQPYAFRYLGSLLFGASWSPIYAKASVSRRRVVHHDLFLAARAGATLERSVIPQGGMPVAPTISPAVGARVFLPNGMALRAELRDDIVFERRKLTGDWGVVQRFFVVVGVSALSAPGETR